MPAGRPGLLVADPDRGHPEASRPAARGAGRSVRAKRVGNPYDSASDIGPLVAERQRDRVEGYIAKGKAEGATLATGGNRPKDLDEGYYVEPTVFGNVAE